MPNGLNFFEDIERLENYLGLPKGGLANIPGYALPEAVSAIKKVQELERSRQFRPGLYYIVLADLMDATRFSNIFGNEALKRRIELFHIACVQAIGELDLKNYVAFSKNIGDATLLIFSSFSDVYAWSNKLTSALEDLSDAYEAEFEFDHGTELSESDSKRLAFLARRLVHLGEVSYIKDIDPVSLAVSQTFHLEKNFKKTELGCTEIVVDAITPLLKELSAKAVDTGKKVNLSGSDRKIKSFYIVNDSAD
ncbi:hypothetical protein [Qipengyuania sp.]|uniref:hypothetical protein n=1 Tax=Qipengyuania sp. TaxID=2004515 RepID=UPI003AF86EB6